ncbi:MAG: hypothetical protein AABY22_07095 [Nanoarchaeota archaeon]
MNEIDSQKISLQFETLNGILMLLANKFESKNPEYDVEIVRTNFINGYVLHIKNMYQLRIQISLDLNEKDIYEFIPVVNLKSSCMPNKINISDTIKMFTEIEKSIKIFENIGKQICDELKKHPIKESLLCMQDALAEISNRK